MIKIQEIRSGTLNDYDTMRDIQDIVNLIAPTLTVATVIAINLDDADIVERYFLAVGTKAELKINKNTINKIEGILESYSFPTMTDRVELIDITLLS